MYEGAARGGHLDALKFFERERRISSYYLKFFDRALWYPSDMLTFVACYGHVHVLQWAIENGASLASPDSADTLSLLLKNVCVNGHFAALEWLIAAHPRILEHVKNVLSEHAPANVRILEVLSSHVGTTAVIEALQSHLIRRYALFAPLVQEWCMQQGMCFDADCLFHRMMTSAALEGDVHLAEHFMRLGATWRTEYLITALQCNQLTFCQWAHKRGDLELDFSGAHFHNLQITTLEWLASIGVFLPVKDGDTFEQLVCKYTDIVPYIIEHYPRYEIIQTQD